MEVKKKLYDDDFEWIDLIAFLVGMITVVFLFSKIVMIILYGVNTCDIK